MFFQTSERIFDTLADTQQKRVSMIKTNFSIRRDITVRGEHPIYLNISRNGYKRERIHLQVYLKPVNWIADTEEIRVTSDEIYDKKLILDNIKKKLTDIKTVYRLSDLNLTPEILRQEYEDRLSRVNFISFFSEALKLEKSKIKGGTYNRYFSVYAKIKEYQEYVPFNTLNLAWFNKYRNYLKFKKHNRETTINSNFATIKKILNIAKKNNIKLMFDVEDIKVGRTDGEKTYLSKEELKKCMDYYFSGFINRSNRLILGYFLFSCMTGLRISNVMRLNRNQLLGNDFSLVIVKGDKDKTISLNQKAKDIINHTEELFIKKYSDQHINDELKTIMKSLGITKNVKFHSARHTFATLFIKMGGKVELLQMLLGHSKLSQTMHYVDIVQADANEQIFLLDNLFVD
ncbi:tyrosine-type recombinase/integrase [Flavobacterium sp. HNIBRBA15423]|uniref:tyrosine-type recombinase/integrase n=1 Tax=Flavobacterium sp. HNIBRBA15423 TaxID=3458683 RepID=UPI0040446E6E